MQLLTFLTLAVTATAAAIPDAAIEERNTACSTTPSAALAAAKAAFTNAKLVPDLIASFNPTVAVSANYNGKQVSLGNTFSVTETVTEPSISFTAERGYDPSTTNYTMFLLDPDAPGPAAPILKDFLHLIISNAKPSCIATQNAETVAPYMPLTPLSVAEHRYTFLVYRQPPNYVPPPSLNYLPGVRNNFDLNAYVAEAGLMGPVGGNYMLEGLDTTVCAITPNCTQDGSGYGAS